MDVCFPINCRRLSYNPNANETIYPVMSVKQMKHSDRMEPETGIALLDTVDRGTLSDRVMRSVAEAIINEKLDPGGLLVESQIAEQMGVSRGPVREALVQLEHMGLVERISHKGTFVRELSEKDLRELYTLRSVLEGLAARLITKNYDTEALELLEGLVEQMQQAAENGDLETLLDLDLQFHNNLCSLSGHELLIRVWMNHLQMRFRLKRSLLLRKERLYTDPMEAVELHRHIVEVICSGDPQAAERAAVQHAIEGGERLVPMSPEE